MTILAVVGGQWGDEGKGKIVDVLAERCQVIARYNGGNNAGHTVVNQHGKFGLHLLPSGIFSPHAVCVIGNGVVINPQALLEELAQVRATTENLARLAISDRAHVIMPYHLLLDRLEEASRGKGSIGTTGKGIGPAYADKYARIGIRLGDFVDAEAFRHKLSFALDIKNRVLARLYDHDPLSFEDLYEEYAAYGRAIAPFVTDTRSIVLEAARRGDNIMLEGAQGAMLDAEFGTYPYVTSSSTLATGGYAGVGLPPNFPIRSLGIFKAYSSRVGGGPFPTELNDETGRRIREIGHEYGTTTGRPRRCGWFDGVASRLAAELNGQHGIALTRLDVLDSFAEIKLCVAYHLGTRLVDRVPANTEALAQCQPVYETLPGWLEPTTEARQFHDLPPRARAYVTRVEELLQCPVDIVSVGPGRQQTIVRRDVFA